MEFRGVGKEIHALSNLLGRKIEAEKRQHGMQDITPVQTWVLRYLHDHKNKEVFQRDLEQEFSITRSTVTGILKLMEKNGLISRRGVPEDARLKKLTLTQKGEEMEEAVRSHMERTEKCLTKGLSEEEVQTFLELVGRIRSNLETQ